MVPKPTYKTLQSIYILPNFHEQVASVHIHIAQVHWHAAWGKSLFVSILAQASLLTSAHLLRLHWFAVTGLYLTHEKNTLGEAKNLKSVTAF